MSLQYIMDGSAANVQIKCEKIESCINSGLDCSTSLETEAYKAHSIDDMSLTPAMVEDIKSEMQMEMEEEEKKAQLENIENEKKLNEPEKQQEKHERFVF